MSELLNQLKDDELDFTVRFRATDGTFCAGEFLDIVNFENEEYVIIDPCDGEGYVDIFRILVSEGKERYERVTDENILNEVFEIFRLKNEDEFDFE